jgi:hypothetical protein
VIIAPAVRLHRKNPADSEEKSWEGITGYPAQIRHDGLKKRERVLGIFIKKKEW